MVVRFDKDKAKKIKEERNIDLAEIAKKIEKGQIIGVAPNKNRIWQVDFAIMYNNYPILCPCEIEEKGFFLRTAYPSRKLKNEYNKKKGNKNE